MNRLVLFLFLCPCAVSSLLAQTVEKTPSTGYFNLTQLSLLIGETESGAPEQSAMIPSVVNISGYRFSEHFSMGLGVGMTPTPYSHFPVFVDMRYTFLKGNLRPVLAIKGGYSFARNSKDFWNYGSNNDIKNIGGGMFNPEIGFRIPMSDSADFLFTLGYWYQRLGSKAGVYTSQVYERQLNFNRLSFTIGFMFN
ncbi:MAG: hypothetical protein LBE56_01800 [Tannerella sp.]|jgi:hypothetical protein|nr:hypothetical protein [Tannerella sp.]